MHYRLLTYSSELISDLLSDLIMTFSHHKSSCPSVQQVNLHTCCSINTMMFTFFVCVIVPSLDPNCIDSRRQQNKLCTSNPQVTY